MKSEQAVIEALHRTGGNVTLSAQMLGMTWRALQDRIARNPNLQQVRDDEREQLIDIAERNVRKAILEGSMDDSWKVLRTIGRRRGYVEKEEIEVKAENINITCGIRPDNK